MLHFHLVKPLLREFLYRECIRAQSLSLCSSVWFRYCHLRRVLSPRWWVPCVGGKLIIDGTLLRYCEMDRPQKVVKGEHVPNCMPDGTFLRDYPLLSEHLTTSAYSDGAKRETSTLTLFVDQGALKIALNDRDMQQSLYKSGKSLFDVLESLELALLEGKADDWRAWGKGRRK